MANADKLRVVFTGHAGLAKSRVLSRLCRYICEHDPTWQSARRPEDRQRIEKRLAQYYEVETDLKPMQSFLDLEWREQQRYWRESLASAIEHFEAEDPQYAFLSLHLSYQWHSGFFSPLGWRIPVATKRGQRLENTLVDFIQKRFKPDYYVTFIDDIYAVQQRIAPGIHFRLRELLTWRSFEILLTDLLARETIRQQRFPHDPISFPFERSPIVAIRHPPEMVYRLLLHPHCPRVYTSFPISRTRPYKECREEIDRFRAALHQYFTVYDPLTIDERPLQSLGLPIHGIGDQANTHVERAILGGGFTLSAVARWTIPAESTLFGEESQDNPNLDPDEIEEITRALPGAKTEIDRTIETRDFRLIDQADCLVVYRPRYRTGNISGGTRGEIEYAKRTRKPVFLIHDPAADRPLAPETFDAEYIGGPYLFDSVRNLSDPENQQRVLQDVIHRLKERSAELAARRLSRS